MQRTIMLILVFPLAMVLAACGGDAPANEGNGGDGNGGGGEAASVEYNWEFANATVSAPEGWQFVDNGLGFIGQRMEPMANMTIDDSGSQTENTDAQAMWDEFGPRGMMTDDYEVKTVSTALGDVMYAAEPVQPEGNFQVRGAMALEREEFVITFLGMADDLADAEATFTDILTNITVNE